MSWVVVIQVLPTIFGSIENFSEIVFTCSISDETVFFEIFKIYSSEKNCKKYIPVLDLEFFNSEHGVAFLALDVNLFFWLCELTFFGFACKLILLALTTSLFLDFNTKLL